MEGACKSVQLHNIDSMCVTALYSQISLTSGQNWAIIVYLCPKTLAPNMSPIPTPGGFTFETIPWVGFTTGTTSNRVSFLNNHGGGFQF